MGYKKSVFRTMTLISQLGINILVPVFLSVLLSNFLLKHFEISLFIPLLIVGILAGGRNAIVLALKFIRESEDDDSRDTERYINKNNDDNSKS